MYVSKRKAIMEALIDYAKASDASSVSSVLNTWQSRKPVPPCWPLIIPCCLAFAVVDREFGQEEEETETQVV